VEEGYVEHLWARVRIQVYAVIFALTPNINIGYARSGLAIRTAKAVTKGSFLNGTALVCAE
jgi:hypothetical protein